MFSTNLLTHRYVPARTPGDRERVVIVLHGLGDSLNGYHFLPEALRLPEVSYLLVNAPDSYYGGYSWYDFMGDKEPGILRSRALLLSLIEELIAGGVRATDIFLFGFSQGCLMVTDVALRCEQVLGGCVGVSGYVAFLDQYPAAFSPAALQQKVLITHGRQDPMVPFEPAKRQFLELKSFGVNLTFKAYDKDHTMLMEELNDISEWMRAHISVAP
jgi:phospholipase/carboxylesterase